MSPESLSVCPECGAPLSSDDLFCPRCLARLPAMMGEGPSLPPDTAAGSLPPISRSRLRALRLRVIPWGRIVLVVTGVLLVGVVAVGAWIVLSPLESP